jgi:tetratricopeptide (TPR) repeat protein
MALSNLAMAIKGLRRSSLVLIAAAAVVATTGCGKVSRFKALKSFKAANAAYLRQDYRSAADLYERTLRAYPDLVQAYFYLGNSNDNLWKPTRKGDPANDALIERAAENYRKAAEKITGGRPEDVKLRKLALQYLAAAYGPNKLNDSSKAVPVVEWMIRLDPSDTADYFALAKLHEGAQRYDDAEKLLLRAKDAQSKDSGVYLQLAAYYNRRGRFDRTIEALEQRAAREPDNPEAYYTIATFYWDKAYRDPRLRDVQKRDYVRKGIEAVDRALRVKPDYVEALVYKNLLLRLAANQEKDRGRQETLLQEADRLRDSAEQLRKKKTIG